MYACSARPATRPLSRETAVCRNRALCTRPGFAFVQKRTFFVLAQQKLHAVFVQPVGLERRRSVYRRLYTTSTSKRVRGESLDCRNATFLVGMSEDLWKGACAVYTLQKERHIRSPPRLFAYGTAYPTGRHHKKTRHRPYYRKYFRRKSRTSLPCRRDHGRSARQRRVSLIRTRKPRRFFFAV